VDTQDIEGMVLALFGRKKAGEDDKDPKGNGAAGNGEGAEAPKPVYSASKAQAFFDRARTAQETTSYEYAMQMWLEGLRQDPTNMKALEAFFQSATAFLGSNSGKPPGKDTMNAFSGRSDLERYLTAVLAWGVRPLDALLAIKAAEASAKLGLPEATHWLGERAMLVAANEKRPRKDLFLKLVDAFAKVGAYDRAVFAGEQAMKLDPLDGRLAADIRNLAAQATMSKGGYEQSGEAGGFRANIRDLDKQRKLEEEERIVKTDEVVDRKLKSAEDDYRSRPEDIHAINKYAKTLVERGRPEDLQRARAVLKKAYEQTKQFNFRQLDGVIKLRQASRKLAEYRQAAEQNPQSQVAKQKYQMAQQEFLRLEIEEYKLCVEAYPTDLHFKYELGKRLFEAGDIDNAIPLFQESQNEAKRRVESQHMLAQAFQKIEYTDEAIHTYRQAMEAHKLTNDDMGMALRYGLMTALQVKAEKERELPAAEEADKIASSLATQQFNYRDIRQRRDGLKKLISELKNGSANGA
jgi:tetratricopeptide (TPR) repeat protein